MRLEQRRSSVAPHPDHEPHLAVQPVLAHESLWLDSGDIPLGVVGDMTPLYSNTPDGFCADTSDHDAIFDRAGRKVSDSFRSGGAGVVRKRVRVPLPVGRFGEYVCVKTIVHENLDVDTAAVYKPLLEASRDGAWVLVPDHLWQLDYAAGVLVLRSEIVCRDLHLTFYEYVGRIGPTDAMRDPTTDLVREGARNKYLSQPKVEEWARGVVASLTTDDLREGDTNLYGTGSARSPETLEAAGALQGAAHVSGTVSSLENHRVIRATVVGNGEGDWVGAMHGCTRGTFDGEASVTGGELQHLHHVAIGGPAGGAPLTVHATGHAHVSLVSSTGLEASLGARGDGSLCTDTMQAEVVRTQQLYSFGIDNAYAGLSRVGDIAGVRHMRAEAVECDRLFAAPGVLVDYADDCTASSCCVRDAGGRLLGRLGRAGVCSSIRIPRLRGTVGVQIVRDEGTTWHELAMSGDEDALQISDTAVLGVAGQHATTIGSSA